MRRKWLLPLVPFLMLGLLAYPSITSAVLYDNFSKTTIDPKKWNSWEFLREIQDGKLVSKTSAYGVRVRNELNFRNGGDINYIEADVTIDKAEGTYDRNDVNVGSFPNARITGFFYNDGTGTSTPGSLEGEVQAALRIGLWRDKLRADWYVWRSTNAASTEGVTLRYAIFSDLKDLKKGTPYKLSISFNPTSKVFTFGVGNTFQTWQSSHTIHPSNSTWKTIATDANVPSGSSYVAKISATFDNVIAKDEFGNEAIKDDFSSPTIDPTKWSTYEIVREVSDKKLYSELRGVDASVSNNLSLKNPELIKDFQAKVTLFDYQNPGGALARSRLGGYFYNDTGDPGSGYLGDVWAEVLIGGSGLTPTANWMVVRMDNFDGTQFTILESGSFSVPINLGQTYLLFIGWDGSKITFKCNDETQFFTPQTPIYPPNNLYKTLSTRIQAPSAGPLSEAFIAAAFDDVKINEPPLPLDGEWLVDITGKDKGGAVMRCDGNTFEGYGLTLNMGHFNMAGEYSSDFLGNVKGHYTVSEYGTGAEIYNGTVTGKIDKKLSKLTLKLEGGVNLNGIKLPVDPDIPPSWTVKITGGAKGFLDFFIIAPYQEDTESYPRLYTISGSGYVLEGAATLSVNISGLFFLTKTNMVYGFYAVSGDITDTGILYGRMTLTSGKFNFTAITSEGGRVTLTGQVKP